MCILPILFILFNTDDESKKIITLGIFCKILFKHGDKKAMSYICQECKQVCNVTIHQLSLQQVYHYRVYRMNTYHAPGLLPPQMKTTSLQIIPSPLNKMTLSKLTIFSTALYYRFNILGHNG